MVFTSGGTEGANLAILGLLRHGAGPSGRHVITTAIEHPAVLGACGQLEKEGAEVSVLPVGRDGVVDPEEVRRALRPNTALVSVMHANNESGAVQPLAEIAAAVHAHGALLHSDGVHAAPRLACDVQALGVDLYSITGHKFNAPKGAGALYVREGVKLQPLQFGGRHERERRPGTENVPSIAALGCAAEWLTAHCDEESARVAVLRDRLEAGLLDRIPDVRIASRAAVRTPNTSNVSFLSVDGEALQIALDLAGFQVSTGSACASGAIEPSHVLSAMGATPSEARSSLRFSLGVTNDAAQVDDLVEALVKAVARQRSSAAVSRHA